MLQSAGCPSTPEQIGISRERLRVSYRQCCYMRRRFTVLDLLQRMGVFDETLDNLFGAQGAWHSEGEA
jgi:glycerol-1-phosphate dehydrogenase [NAD(P)+]